MTDQELDRLLYAHAGAARDLVLAQLPPEGELPDIPTSPRFQRRMKALIRRADRPGWAKAALRCARQAAVILLVCGTLTFSGLMLTSQAFRTQVKRSSPRCSRSSPSSTFPPGRKRRAGPGTSP